VDGWRRPVFTIRRLCSRFVASCGIQSFGIKNCPHLRYASVAGFLDTSLPWMREGKEDLFSEEKSSCFFSLLRGSTVILNVNSALASCFWSRLIRAASQRKVEAHWVLFHSLWTKNSNQDTQ